MIHSKIQQNIVQYTKTIQVLLCIFFTVGISGFLYPPTSSLLITLIPFVLLGNFLIVLLFDQTVCTAKHYIVFALIFLFGLGIEIIGVSTKTIFGNYTYGNGLGIKVLHTPLLIGLNWLFLIYTTRLLFQSLRIPEFAKIIAASISMLIYDFFLEHSAPKMDMWYWKDSIIPLQNYVSWFIISVMLHSFISLAHIHITNKIAKTILFIQFIFFVILYIGL